MLVSHTDMLVESVQDRFLIFVHSKKPPTDSDMATMRRYWNDRRDHFSSMRCLAVTDGGGPTASQRQLMSAEFSGLKPIRTAVVSDASLMRFVVSGIALFNSQIRTFHPAEWTNALQFLDCPLEVEDRIRRTLWDMHGSVPRGRFVTLDKVCGTETASSRS
jgi:hypothetical protein